MELLSFQHAAEIMAFLFALSELLALVPKLKSNSVFQLVYNGIRQIAMIIKK